MKVLITGVTSFIGKALAAELLAEGIEVYGTVRPGSEKTAELPEKVNIIECDMAHFAELPESGVRNLYACIHLAWSGSAKEDRMNPEMQKANVENTLQLISAAREMGCERFVFAGSQAEYGILPGEILETSECHPVSAYGKAKLEVLRAASERCGQLGMTYIHPRIFSVYGPGDRPTTLVSSCVNAFVKGETVHLSKCAQMWNFLYISDCAKALADLTTCVFTMAHQAELTEHVVLVGSAESMPLREYVERIHKVIGSGAYVLEEKPEPAEGTPQLEPSVRRLQQITGFCESVSFEEGIRKTEKRVREK